MDAYRIRWQLGISEMINVKKLVCKIFGHSLFQVGNVSQAGITGKCVRCGFIREIGLAAEGVELFKKMDLI